MDDTSAAERVSTLKRCAKCRQHKPATSEHFSAFKEGKLGLHPWCRECLRAYTFDLSIRSGKVKRHQTPPQDIGGVMHRLCRTCEQWKPATSEFFQAHRSARLGVTTQCRDCMNAASREYAERNSDKAVAKAAAWNSANSERHYQHLRATLQKRRGAPGSFTADDIREKLASQRNRCHYCQVELDASYHVDHFVALTKGGTNFIDNIVIACRRCNQRKGTKDPNEFLAKMRKLFPPAE